MKNPIYLLRIQFWTEDEGCFQQLTSATGLISIWIVQGAYNTFLWKYFSSIDELQKDYVYPSLTNVWRNCLHIAFWFLHLSTWLLTCFLPKTDKMLNLYQYWHCRSLADFSSCNLLFWFCKCSRLSLVCCPCITSLGGRPMSIPTDAVERKKTEKNHLKTN